jgi:hypothetical protein
MYKHRLFIPCATLAIVFAAGCIATLGSNVVPPAAVQVASDDPTPASPPSRAPNALPEAPKPPTPRPRDPNAWPEGAKPPERPRSHYESRTEAKPEGPVTGFINPLGFRYFGPRLAFSVAVVGGVLRDDEYSRKYDDYARESFVPGPNYPAWVELTGPGYSQRVPVLMDSYAVARPACEPETPSCRLDVSSAKPGHYTFTLQYRGKSIASLPLDFATVRTVGGESSVSMTPRQFAHTAVIGSSGRLEYGFTMDLRAPVAHLAYVWLADDRVLDGFVQTIDGPRIENSNSLLVADMLPIADYPPAKIPHGDHLDLVVINNGDEVMDTFTLPDAAAGATYGYRALSLSKLSSAALAAARKWAGARYDKHPGPETSGDIHTWPEPVICAVVKQPAAREAFHDMLTSADRANWQWFDAASAHDAALDPNISEAERSERKRDMVSHGHARAGELAHESAATARLKRFTRAEKTGCFAKLL